MRRRRKGVATTLYEMMGLVGDEVKEDALLMDAVLLDFVRTGSIKARRTKDAKRQDGIPRAKDRLPPLKRASAARSPESSAV